MFDIHFNRSKIKIKFEEGWDCENSSGILSAVSQTVEGLGIIPPGCLSDPDSLPSFPKLHLIGLSGEENTSLTESVIEKVLAKMPNLTDISFYKMDSLTGECFAKCLKARGNPVKSFISISSEEFLHGDIIEILFTFHTTLEIVLLDCPGYLIFPSSFPVFPKLKKFRFIGGLDPLSDDDDDDDDFDDYDCTEEWLKALQLMPNLEDVSISQLMFNEEKVAEGIKKFCPKATTVTLKSYSPRHKAEIQNCIKSFLA